MLTQIRFCVNIFYGEDDMTEEITNQIFQRMLRMEMKKLKRLTLKSADYSKLFRRWAKYKIELNAIRQLMIDNPEIANDEWEKLIKLNPTTLKFVNDCLIVVPDMLNLLKSQGYNEVFNEFYKRRKEYAKLKNNRCDRTKQVDNLTEEANINERSK